MKIAIVTDSTADLPQDLVEEFNIEVIPLQVIIDGCEFRDGLDLSRTEFYERITAPGSHLPSTSQPSPGVFIETYNRLLEEADAIISIHISNKLSGTVQTAQLASETFPGKIRVIDSLSTSMGLGSLVLEAARGLKRGMNLDQVVEMVHSLREKISFFVLLDTLKFVRHGGRVNSVQLFLGSVLKIKPLLRIRHGEVEAAGKARNKKEAVTLLIEKFKEQLGTETKSIISVIHTKAETEALKLKAIIEETFKNAEVILNQAGPTIGSHAGPGALALISLPIN